MTQVPDKVRRAADSAPRAGWAARRFGPIHAIGALARFDFGQPLQYAVAAQDGDARDQVLGQAEQARRAVEERSGSARVAGRILGPREAQDMAGERKDRAGGGVGQRDHGRARSAADRASSSVAAA